MTRTRDEAEPIDYEDLCRSVMEIFAEELIRQKKRPILVLGISPGVEKMRSS